MHNDNAVSPVIGVILLICITVLMAAIVAGMVFTMAGEQKQEQTNIGFKSEHLNDKIVITVMSMDSRYVPEYKVMINEEDKGSIKPSYAGEIFSYSGYSFNNNEIKIMSDTTIVYEGLV